MTPGLAGLWLRCDCNKHASWWIKILLGEWNEQEKT